MWQRPEAGGVRATRAEALRGVRGALRAQRGGRAAQSAADGTSGVIIRKARQKARPVHSKEPQWDKFQDYLKGEVRFASVAKQFPKEADELFAAAQENAQWRYKSYLRMLGTAW